jgi:putative oxidoreductase
MMEGGVLLIIGRVLLGGLFVLGGVRHFGDLDPLTEAIRARGVPLPRASLIGASLFQAVAGAMLMLGVLVPWAVAGLIVFTLVSSAVMLDFWNKPREARNGMINVWCSNIAIIGGLLIAASVNG